MLHQFLTCGLHFCADRLTDTHTHTQREITQTKTHTAIHVNDTYFTSSMAEVHYSQFLKFI